MSEVSQSEVQDETLRKFKQRLTSISYCVFASFFSVSKFKYDDSIPTLCIRKNIHENLATILINEKFVLRYCRRTEKFYICLIHELLHHAKAHLDVVIKPEDFPIWGIASDCVINLQMSKFDSINDWILNDLLSDIYQKGPLRKILVPSDVIEQEAHGKSPGKIIAPLAREDKVYEIFIFLKRYFKAHNIVFSSQILSKLLGSHKKLGQKSQPLDGTIQRILEEVSSKLPGYAENLDESYRKIRKTNAYKKILKLLKPIMQVYDRQERTLVPRNITRSGIIWLYLGYVPVIYNMEKYKEKREKVTVFLDVSGSMNQKIEVLLGIAQALNLYLDVEFYQFSNKAVPFTIEDLRKGRIKSTWGTDFDCVLKKILEKRIDHSIIITDGYANAKRKLIEEVNRKSERGLTIEGVLVKATRAPDLRLFCKKVITISSEDFKENDYAEN